MSCVNMFKNKRISSVDGDKDKEQFHKFLTNYVPVNRFDFINFDFKVTRLNDFLKIYTISGEKYPDISLHFHLYSQSWVELCLQRYQCEWRLSEKQSSFLYIGSTTCVTMKWLHWGITPNHLKSPRNYFSIVNWFQKD